jgi:glycosyltransferase involved in cell wall biosynthesis
VDALTICAANYLPFAKVLAKSFIANHPNSKFYLLLVDGDVTGVDPTLVSGMQLVKPSDLDITSEKFLRMTVYYDVTELSTALKPLGLKYLLDKGSKIAIYLDPDIQVFSELKEIPEHLQVSNIALTPHTLHGIPRDDLRPSDKDIMSSGTFNLGFIAVKNSEQTYEFLEWWNTRLEFDCISDIENNLFTDQRWIDFVPSYFNCSIMRDYGYNVAYWNLHERALEQVGDNVLVNGQPLRFMHFSGYRPDKPWILSKYVADKPRVTISQQPVFKSLADRYGSVAQGFGWESETSVKYGYSYINKYFKLTPSLRRKYRDQVIEAAKGKADFPPLPNDSVSAFARWIDGRTAESGRLSSALYAIWKSRPDLQSAFPNAASSDSERYVGWAYEHGIGEGVITESEIKLFDDEITNDEVNESFTLVDELGVNMSGYLRGEFGVGQFGRLVARSITHSGLPSSTLNNADTESRQEEDYETPDIESLYRVTVGAVNADQYLIWMATLPSELKRNSKFVGVWAWEVDDFPSRFFSAFDLVDEIWAISGFVRDSIQPHTKKPVFVVPAPIIAPEITEGLDYAGIGLSDTQPFNLFMFDYFSVFRRKNPLDLIAAHKAAFPDGDGPVLVIKTVNAKKSATQHEQLLFSIAGREDIIVIDKYLSREQLHSLVNECETYISLHRSEGYGLTIAEAMSLGKPVIATGYSGNIDFMSPTNSILVPFELVPVGDDAYPYDKNAKWAQPDLGFAADAMRKLHEDPELRTRLGTQAKMDVTSAFTIDRAADFVRARVVKLHSSGKPARRVWRNRVSK